MQLPLIQTTLTDILHALVSHDYAILLDQQVAKDILGFVDVDYA